MHGKPGNAIFAGRRDQLGETFLDCRVGKAVPGVGAKGHGGQPLDRRSGPAIHLAAVEMGAIELEPIEAVAGKARQLGVDDAVGEERSIVATGAGADQGIDDELARGFRLEDDFGHWGARTRRFKGQDQTVETIFQAAVRSIEFATGRRIAPSEQ